MNRSKYAIFVNVEYLSLSQLSPFDAPVLTIPRSVQTLRFLFSPANTKPPPESPMRVKSLLNIIVGHFVLQYNGNLWNIYLDIRLRSSSVDQHRIYRV